MKKWIVLPDIHLPYIDMKTMLAVEQYMKDNKFDGWLCLGDMLDFNEISRFNQDAPRRKTELVRETFEAGNKFLDRQQNIILKNNPKAEFVYLEGNHEYRVEDYMDKHEELDGLLDIEKNLYLKERKVKFVRSWSKGEPFNLGNAHFTHGQYVNKYHANKMVSAYGACIYYGHTHDVMEYPQTYRGDDKTIVGKSLGCLCDYNQKYLRGNSTNWQQAFAIFYFFDDGYFTEQTVRIFKHRFVSPEGKIYDGEKTKTKVLGVF